MAENTSTPTPDPIHTQMQAKETAVPEQVVSDGKSDLTLDSLAIDESKGVKKTLSDPDDSSVEAVRPPSLSL